MPQKFRSAATLGAFAAILAIATVAGTLLIPRNPVQASRILQKNNDLYRLEDGREQRLTTTAKVTMLFAEHDSLLLYGERINTTVPDSEDAPKNNLLLLDTNNGDTKLLHKIPVRDALFSPSGQIIYFVSSDDFSLYMMNVDGTAPKKIQDKVLTPRISPDGTMLVYQKLNADWQQGDYFDRALGLTILDLTTLKERQISSTWEDFSPLWSTDGKNIVFYSRSPQGIASQFTIKADGTNRLQLTNLGQTLIDKNTVPIPSEKPTWSNDGRFLTYESDHEIWLTEFSTNKDKMLSAKRLGYGRSPRFATDTTISFLVAETKEGTPHFLIIDLDGNVLR